MFKAFVLFLFLFSCNNLKYPTWFIQSNIVKDKLYGLGSGVTLEEAKKVAISDIAGQIRTTVSSKTTSLTREDSRIGYETSFTQDISNKVNDTTITNIVIVNSDQIEDGRFVIKVMIEKSKLIEEYKTELNLLEEQINNNYSNYTENNDILKKRRYLKQVISLNEQAKLLATILYSLDYNINKDIYISNMARYENQLDKVNKQINFRIKGTETDIINVIKKSLNIMNFNVQNGTSNQNTLTIILQTKDIIKNIFDENIITKTINLELKDAQNNTVYTNIIEINGSSMISEEDAQKNIATNLSHKFETENILSFLGL